MRWEKKVILVLVLMYVDLARATEFEKMGNAISKALGTTKAFKTTHTLKTEPITVFYSKDASGKAEKLAIVEKRLYEPNCTHTWVIGLNAKTAKVEQIRVVEMSCPHAFPTKENSYLEQYQGKGPAQAKTLKADVHTVAKATGSSELTTDAVVESIIVADKLKGKI